MYGRFLKRGFDFIFSLVGIIILLPFFLIFTPIVAFAMKGNPFFVQRRNGKSEKVFYLIKYRTMNNRKDSAGKLLPDKDRLTKFGKTIRKFSIDELPELFNILIGKMSLVGPRPLPLVYQPYYSDTDRVRFNVRPGLTGLAQISGRNDIDWDGRFALDAEYVNHVSLFVDIKIFLMTFVKVLKGSDVSVMGTNSSIKSFYDFADARSQYSEYEIGSSFSAVGDCNKNDYLPNTDASNVLFVNSGRNAIKTVLENEENTAVSILPNFTCGSVLKPFYDSSTQILYYNIRKDLTVDEATLFQAISSISGKKIVYLSCYFGSYHLGKIKQKLGKQKDIVIIEDLTHCYYSDMQFENATYYIASTRKWAGTGEGGVIITNRNIKDIPTSDGEISDIFARANSQKNDYMDSPESSKKELYRASFNAIIVCIEEKSIQKISDSAYEAYRGINVCKLRESRRNNFNALSDMLTESNNFHPVIQELNKKEIPLYFPLYVENRKTLQEYMALNKIYCPVIWPMSDYVKDHLDNNAKYIYDHILCIPIDQRYNVDDMKRIYKNLREYVQ